jgi:ankyrin repeat protein
MIAAGHGQLPCVELLLEAGLDVNASTKDGRTALMMGAGQNSLLAIVPVLLKAGADVRARDSQGRTPLMFAADHGSVENIQALLGAGADVAATDKDGKTALDLARQPNYVGALSKTKVLEAAIAQKKVQK